MAKQSAIEQDGVIVEALYVINKKNPKYKQRQG